MAENLSDLRHHTVSRDTYTAGLECRASADEVTERWDDRTEEDADPSLLVYPRRLLVPLQGRTDEHHAIDDFVQIVGLEGLVEDRRGPIILSVRQALQGGQRGKLETFRIAADGIILNKNENTPNMELGYLVDVPGVSESDLQSLGAEVAIPRSQQHLGAEAVSAADQSREL